MDAGTELEMIRMPQAGVMIRTAGICMMKTVTHVLVGHTDELYQLLLRNTREAREIRKSLRKLDKTLAQLGYQEAELPPRIIQNLDFARANMKANIYDQAVLEGVATSFPQTEEIIENGKVNGMTASDVQKILNLKHAWEFILDQDVIQAKSDYYVLCHIARLVNEGFFADGGRIRGAPVTIGGSSYIPPLPMEFEVSMTCYLPSYEITEVNGFSKEEIERYMEVIRSAANLIIYSSC